MPKGWVTLEVPVPKSLWVCIDCETVSDFETSNIFHVGCAGRKAAPKAGFVTKNKPTLRGGEIVWIDREPEHVGGQACSPKA